MELLETPVLSGATIDELTPVLSTTEEVVVSVKVVASVGAGQSYELRVELNWRRKCWWPWAWAFDAVAKAARKTTDSLLYIPAISSASLKDFN